MPTDLLPLKQPLWEIMAKQQGPHRYEWTEGGNFPPLNIFPKILKQLAAVFRQYPSKGPVCGPIAELTENNNKMERNIMKTRIQSTEATLLIGLALAGGSLTAPPAMAAKPGGGVAPAYTYVNLGTCGQPYGEALAINAFGLVVGRVVNESNKSSAYVVVPKDTNNDGRPDRWFEDADGDGLNDLQLALGSPPGMAALGGNLTAVDINDYGQILIAASYGAADHPVFVLTPRDLDNDGRVEFFSAAPDGGNLLIDRLPLDGRINNITPTSINNLGQITGYYSTPTPTNPDEALGIPLGFVVSGKDTDADGVADLWFEDSGTGVNGLAQMLGKALDRIGRLAGLSPAKINERGEIAGRVAPPKGGWDNVYLIRPRATANGLTWWVDENQDGLNDLVTKLLPVKSSAWGDAYALNESGKVVGWGTLTSASTTFAALWQVNQEVVTTTKLPKIGGEDFHIATAINSQDVVVGETTTYGPGISIRSSCAFVVLNGVAKDLRTLTDQAAALNGAWLRAWDINDAGQIIGSTMCTDRPDHPFIAVPVN